jgi:hypothetical protein
MLLLGAIGCGSNTINASGTDVVDANTTITLDRTVCFGACPSYSLSIGGDGTVTYTGRQFVKLVGTATSQIPLADVQSLVDEMERSDYFHLTVPDTCPQGMATDNPTATTSLQIAGKSHVVTDYHGAPCAPAVLRTLEDRIDSVAQSAQWVKCDGADYCAR